MPARILRLGIIGIILSLPAMLSWSQNLKSGGKVRPEQAIQDIRHYTISLQVDPEDRTINGFTDIEFILLRQTGLFLFDFWHGLQVSSITVNGKKVSYTHTEDDLIRIARSDGFAPGRYKVRVNYGGKPGVAARAPWDGGFTWAKDGQGNHWVAITCQGEGGKIYFPCKDHPSDEPDEGADMLITVPNGLTVAGPGLLRKSSSKGEWSTFHWSTQYPIANYCLVFNIGKYAKVSKTYTTVAGNRVPMDFYVLEEHKEKGPHHLDVLERTCRVMEKYFGEYPWVKEKIGIAETPHLGMEHQTMNAYGNGFKYTKVGGEDFDWLLTHEFGHEWWANKITNRDWAHMWIQEGICSFGDALYQRELEGEESYLKRMQRTAWAARNEKPIVLGDEVDSDDAYHGDIYGKGAFFMHTLRFVIGDSLFFPILKKLAADPKYSTPNSITTQDVQDLFANESGNPNVGPLFDLYLRTTHKLDISLVRKGEDKYQVKLLNYKGSLPVEVLADGAIRKVTLGEKVTDILSKTPVEIDPRTYYLKRLIIE